jgi:hypothetical protein
MNQGQSASIPTTMLIPTTILIPTSFDNEVIPTVLKNYCSGIETPTDFDCLCGKDTTFGNHPGNRIFRQKILDSLPLYRAAKSKMDKMRVTKSVIEFMKKKNSRFLKLKNNGSWAEIDGQSARDKISHALRFAVSQQKKQVQENQSDSSSESDCSESIETRFSGLSALPSGLSAPPRLFPSSHKQTCSCVTSLMKPSQPLVAACPPPLVTNREHCTSLRRPSFSRNDSAKGIMSLLSSTDDNLEFDIHQVCGGRR